MSSVDIPGGGSGGVGGGGRAPQEYYCYQCESTVTITPSPAGELICPNCHGGFLEESGTAPRSNPHAYVFNDDDIDNSFFSDDFPSAAAFGGFPIMFSSSSATATPGGAAFSGRRGLGVSLDDLSALFGGGARYSSEFDPYTFLNNYINNLQSRGANIQFVFESPGGGEGMDFRLPADLGDYFVGPGLEQLIQQLAENDPNRYGTPPASKSAVEALLDIKITEEMLASDSSQCAMCMDSFELNEAAKQMPCKHVYHKDCILPWLELHNSCPVCRYELPTDDPDYENQKMGQMNNNSTSNNNDNLGLGLGSSSKRQGSSSYTNAPRMVERRFNISLPWLLRGLDSSAETSSSGGAGDHDGRSSSSNYNNNNEGPNASSRGGRQSGEDHLD